MGFPRSRKFYGRPIGFVRRFGWYVMYCDVMSKHIHMKIWDETLFHTNVDQMRTAWWLSTAGKTIGCKVAIHCVDARRRNCFWHRRWSSNPSYKQLISSTWHFVSCKENLTLSLSFPIQGGTLGLGWCISLSHKLRLQWKSPSPLCLVKFGGISQWSPCVARG